MTAAVGSSNLPSVFNGIKATFEKDPIKPYLIQAIAIITMLGGIFLILASFQVLPSGVNVVSQLGIGGKVLSYGVLGAGSVLSVVRSILTLSPPQKPFIDEPASPPVQQQLPKALQPIVDQWQSEAETKEGDVLPELLFINIHYQSASNSIVHHQIPEALQSTLDQWLNEAEQQTYEEFARRIAYINILICYQKQIPYLSFFLDTTSLPDVFNYLSHLTGLSISCKLETLPESLKDLKKLKKLTISGTDLQTLPDTIGELESLEILYLPNNHLYKLLDSFKNLRNLSVLHIGVNEFQTLPEWLFQMPKIRKITARCNYIQGDDVSAIQNQVARVRETGRKLECDCLMQWTLPYFEEVRSETYPGVE